MENAGPAAPGTVTVNNYQHAQDNIWSNGPVQLARGRQARDPNQKTITYDVSSLDEFETSLREYLRNPPDNPEHTDCQLSFWIGATFAVSVPAATQPGQQQQQQQHSPQQLTPLAQQPSHPHHLAHQHPHAPAGYQPANGLQAPQYGTHPAQTYQSVSDPAIALTLPAYASASNSAGHNGTVASPANAAKDKNITIRMSISEALQGTQQPREKMRKQRAIAKCCIDAIQKIDGYRYSFHNCWNSREDDSFRFSYYCNDSLLNKDRAANGKGSKLGKRATKPVYDCKGVLSVKFSASKESLDVFYKHNPVHKTYEERAPPPRKDSKRRKWLEVNDPDALSRIATRPKPAIPSEELEEVESPPKPKKKRTKKDTDHKSTASNSIESDLRAQSLRSLLELIQTDPPAPDPAPPEPPPPPSLPPPQQQHQLTSIVGHGEARPFIPQPPNQSQAQAQQPRRRPRNSCDVCKTKKTKCDGARPVCNTCTTKNRQCIYLDAQGEDRRQSQPVPAQAPIDDAIQQLQTASDGLSELERMKKALDEAKARIYELEAEKTRSSATPSQTPQASRPPSQHLTQSQPQPQPQRQQKQKQKQQVQMQQPQQQKQQQMQMQPQLHAQQLQTPQYGAFNNQTAFGMNRSMSSQSTTHPVQPQPQPQSQPPPQPNRQMQTSSAAMAGLPAAPEANNPYSREFTWPAAYFNYQTQQQQQQQQDPWAAAPRNSVFR
ncbi:hypothetical protein BDV95DRAFT_166281 [Massariosphaeria phaeospora]|uniref:Zn(2)-C6 fungal-type domain-containing protein n=1 Tax=Massariosphaeria phaeospora TaxID=100035 RepID=A0A7C8M7G6_9PLEO|nr:hypothetical protein BDV95DRAFT_166281 [Massariosphaeria phaeospora]